MFDELTRLPAIEADLTHLIGDDWSHRSSRSPPPRPTATASGPCASISRAPSSPTTTPATSATCPAGGTSAGSSSGCTSFEDDGASFFTFAAIDDAKAFKDDYRARLDEAPWSPDEQDAVIAEIRNAYRLDRDVFADLDATVA